jgi:hypothetical protein
MRCRVPAVLAAGAWALAVLPGVAVAQPVETDLITGASGPLRAAASFALVLAFGGLVLYRWGGLVDRSIDALVDRPKIAVLYGLVAYLIVLAVGFYGLSQLGRVGVASTPVGSAGFLGIGAAVMLLTGFGFLVVGTLLTDLRGRRRPDHGLVIGAALSAVGWLVLPLVGALAVWVVVAAFGIGGSTRRYLHAERTVETESKR